LWRLVASLPKERQAQGNALLVIEAQQRHSATANGGQWRDERRVRNEVEMVMPVV
jgi:hypothetical protein